MEANSYRNQEGELSSSALAGPTIRAVLSGLSSMCATTVTNPIDVIKTRMQVENELSLRHTSKNIFHDRYYPGFIRGVSRIAKEEGPRGLWRGVTVALLRDSLYSSLRMGLYEPVKVSLGSTDPAHTPLWKKILAGVISGAIASAIANPTDVVKARFMAVPSGTKWMYRHTFHAFSEIAVKEGVSGLWAGVGPTMSRAAMGTASLVATYDHTKHCLLNEGLMKEGPSLHIVSSVCAGLVNALVISPVDVTRTRYMNQRKSRILNRRIVYKSAIDCFVKTVKGEGFLGLYKGLIPNWTRNCSHTIITFLMFEYLRKCFGIAPL